ncbi:hypothetical protein [Primorskyibacter sedentarius]|uniref:hypothetical protein n=1 Tax=Primorskyibacter sedentarius TaxID=745311 RepID=UPI003EC00181
MTDAAENDEIEKLKRRIERLESDLRAAEKARDLAVYEREVADWVMRGLASAKISITINEPCIDASKLVRVLDGYREVAARGLLHEAKLAFNSHAELFEAKQTIRRLINHVHAMGGKPDIDERLPNKLPHEMFRPRFYCGYAGPGNAEFSG